MSPFPHSRSTIRGASGSSTKRDQLSVLVAAHTSRWWPGSCTPWERPLRQAQDRLRDAALRATLRTRRRAIPLGSKGLRRDSIARVRPGIASLVRLADERRMHHVDEWRRDDRRRGGDEDPEGVGSQARRRRRWASSSTRHSVGSGMRGLIAILGALVVLPACAHDQWANGAPVPDWVKASCCGPADAHHLTSDQVHRDGDYYRVDGFLRPIPIAVALPSQDGDYWIFYRDKDGAPGINGGGSGGQSGVYCFFVPMAF